MRHPLILDLETQYTFREFADPKKLAVSVVGIYDYADRLYKTYMRHELSQLFPVLEHASCIIGFNIVSFDLAVLQGHYPGHVSQFKTFDLLDDIKKRLGRRLALNDLVFATLGKRKSGHGLQAIELFKEGRLNELKKYCLDDVSLTKELYEYGITHKEIFYLHGITKQKIPVDWKMPREEHNGGGVSLTLPF